MGVPVFLVSALAGIVATERHCISTPLGTIVITGPKALDFFCAHRATSIKSDGRDILSVTLVPNSDNS
jgi:hypothetical protein